MSFAGALATLLGVLFFRNFLETFSDVDNMWTSVSSIAFLIHYPMFHLSFFLAVTIVLCLLAREPIIKVTKVTICFIPIVLLAPVLDLLFSRGKGLNMGYMFNDLAGLLRRYVMFMGGCSPHGATVGIRVELIVVFLCLGTYLFLKTRKTLRVLTGAIVLYTYGFVLGALPSVVSMVWTGETSAGEAALLFAGSVVLNHFYTFNHRIALLLFPILVITLLVWYRLYDARKLTAILRNIRGPRALHYTCMLGIGMVIGYSLRPQDLLGTPFLPLILVVSAMAVVLAWWHAVGENDIHDIAADRLSNPERLLPSGTMGTEELRAINAALLILSLVAAYLIRYAFFLPILVSIGLSYCFSAPPFRLKRIPFVATLISALCSVLVCLAGFVLFSNDYSFYGFPPRVILTMLVVFPLAFTVKDIKDREGDRIDGVVTLPVLLRERRGKQLIGALVLLSYLVAPVLLQTMVLLPVSVVFGFLTYVLINRKRFREGPVFALYYVFFALVSIAVYRQLSSG
jgi:4-hydroxybenzoate polyprenyltransferase